MNLIVGLLTTLLLVSEPIDTIPITTEITESVEQPSEEDIVYMAKTLWGECRGVDSKMEQAAVAWCILNRVDHPEKYGDTVKEVVTAPHQFSGYLSSNPVDNEMRELAEDVLDRWYAEKVYGECYGRVLPKDYYYFVGFGGRNHFMQVWKSGVYYDWHMPDPYDNYPTITGREDECLTSNILLLPK